MSPSQILVVEDERDIADMMIFLLQKEGYEAQYAANGALALEFLSTASADLILTDVMMPVMGGDELLKSLRSVDRLRTIPVLVLSALSEEVVRELCEGMSAFLRKPFHGDQLLAAVRTLLTGAAPIDPGK